MTEKKATFSAEERAAMKEYAAEKRNQAKFAKTAAEKAANLKMCTNAIAKMSPKDKKIAGAIHKIVLEVAPQLAAKTWYGMPAYANEEGKPVLFVQSGDKFKTRYCTLGFTDSAKLDKGEAWPSAYAVTEFNAATDKLIRQLVKKAAA